MPPFAWRDFLPLAQQLQVAIDEASLRTAVGRAYYAAYGTAEERRKADGIALAKAKGGMHKRLWLTYRRDADQRRRQVGIDGDRLHRSRVGADYHPTVAPPRREATRATLAADQLIKDIDAL